MIDASNVCWLFQRSVEPCALGEGGQPYVTEAEALTAKFEDGCSMDRWVQSAIMDITDAHAGVMQNQVTATLAQLIRKGVLHKRAS